jgi:3-hydroxy acid dehydrogenase/malonic semialdehyde reductase
MKERKIALITGASSGIGWSTALALAEKDYDLILCARRSERLQQLSDTVKVETYQLIFDVRDKQAVFQAIEGLPERWKSINVLLNNAGNAHGLDAVQEANLDDWEAMIDSNVKGLMYVTKAVLPLLRESSWGHIVNVGSIAGKEAYPKGSVYCASKAAVQYFTDGLRLDLNPELIRVSAIHPGLVETEFSMVRFKGDADRSKTVYQGADALRAEDVADAIVYMVEAPKSVTITELVILPTRQASAYVINRES